VISKGGYLALVVLRVLATVLCLVSVVGCQRSPLGPDNFTDVIVDDHRSATASVALAVAERQAKTWNRQALLHEIAPTYIMHANLGLPSGVPGWFFMFKDPASPVELYVKVVGGEVNGWTEAQPILAEQLPFRMLPIDFRALPFDSDRVLRIFADNGGSQYVASHPSLELDYRLVHLQSQPNPVWSLFDAANPSGSALVHVDAVTGKTVGDPFAQ
jgi:hypothetical protein